MGARSPVDQNPFRILVDFFARSYFAVVSTTASGAENGVHGRARATAGTGDRAHERLSPSLMDAIATHIAKSKDRL